jgi:hypothetical protein
MKIATVSTVLDLMTLGKGSFNGVSFLKSFVKAIKDSKLDYFDNKAVVEYSEQEVKSLYSGNSFETENGFKHNLPNDLYRKFGLFAKWTGQDKKTLLVCVRPADKKRDTKKLFTDSIIQIEQALNSK